MLSEAGLSKGQSPKLELSVKREYSEPGHYAVVVKVMDILGNDPTKTLTVEIKHSKPFILSEVCRARSAR
jgi:hypothetical protein